MSTKFAQLQFRTDTTANLRAAPQPFAVGEPVYSSNDKILKIGDGTHGWDALPALSAVAEHYAIRGEITGDGGQTITINVGDADVKEVIVCLEATGTISAPVGSLLAGYVNFGTGAHYLNYMGGSSYYIGSYWNNHNMTYSKTLANGHYYVTLSFYSSGQPTYGKWINGCKYRWYAIPTAAPSTGGTGYSNYISIEATPASTTSMAVTGIGFEPKRAVIYKKTGQGAPTAMEPLNIYYYDDLSQQPSSALQPGQAYVMYINGSGAWISSTIGAAVTTGSMTLTISNALAFDTSATYVCSFYG